MDGDIDFNKRVRPGFSERKIDSSWSGISEPIQTNKDIFQSNDLDLNVPEKPKSRWWLILVCALIFLILIVAGVIFANEKGYVNWNLEKYYSRYGLEKLWQGVTIDPVKALIEAGDKSNAITSYNLASQLIIKVSYDTTPAKTGVDQEVKSTNASFQSEINKETKIILTNNAGLESRISFDNISAMITDALNGQTGLNDIPKSTVSLIVTDKIYLQTDEVKNENKWYMTGFDEKYKLTKAKMLGSENLLVSLKSLGQNITNASYLGREKKDKVFWYHFRASVEAKNLEQFSYLTNIQKPVSLDYWISQQDHLVQKIVISVPETDITSQGLGMRLSMDNVVTFTDLNQIDSIRVPDADLVEETSTVDFVAVLMASLSGTDLGNLSSEEIQITVRDIQRKQDLQSIELALGEYEKANDGYPISLETTKTNAENTPLSKLVPKYLSKLPTDPLDSTYYYGYKSSGSAYQLTCILEDKTDSDGTKVGKNFLYILPKEEIKMESL